MAQYLNFDRAGFLIFGIVFVTLKFEVGTNFSYKESIVSSRMGLFL